MEKLHYNSVLLSDEPQIPKDQDIMIMSDVQEVAKLFTKEYSIIWFDPKANLAQYDQYKKKLQELGEILIFDQFPDAYNSIQSASTYCHVILAGEEGEFIAQEMQILDKVLGIYVYHPHPEEIKAWDISENKLLGVTSQIEELFPLITKGVREKSIPIFSFPVFTTNFNDHDKSKISKLHYYLKGLVNFKNRQQGKNDLLLLAKKIHEDPLILTFQRNYKKYDMKMIFNWYTRQSFLYKITNNCLRVATSDSILYCRMILQDLERAIREQYHQKSKRFNGLLFRGAYISEDKWKTLEGNIGKEIEMHGFLSTTKLETKATDFLKADINNKMFITIIVPPLLTPDGQGFAEVKEFSDFPSEEEILFNVRSRFKILEARVGQVGSFHCRHLVLFYGTEALQRYITENKPCISINKKPVICNHCDRKSDSNSLIFVDLLDENHHVCDDCLRKHKNDIKSEVLCSATDQLKVSGIIMQYSQKLKIPFYGYKCHQCKQTEFETAYRYIGGSNSYHTLCDKCFAERKLHSEVVIAERVPWTFWSQGMLEKDKNYSDYQKDLNFEISSFIQGDVFFRAFEYEKTIKYYQQFFYQKNYHNSFDKDLCKILMMLSKAYFGLGKYAEAKEYSLISLDAHKLIFGESHKQTAASFITLGQIYFALKEYKLALLQYEATLPIIKELYGEKHPEVAAVYLAIGSTIGFIGKRENALQYLDQALEIWKSAYGEKHPEIANAYQGLSNIYKNWNSISEAKEYAFQALDLRKAIYGLEHPEVADSFSALGSLFDAEGKYAETESYLVAALKIRAAVFGEKNQLLAGSLQELELFYEKTGQGLKAINSLLLNPEYNHTLISSLPPELKKPEKIRFTMNLKITELVYGKNHPKTANLFDYSVYYYRNVDDEEASFNCSKKVAEIRAANYGELNPGLRFCFFSLAETHHKLGKNQEALEYALKAKEIFESFYPQSQSNRKHIYQLLAEIYEKLEQHEKSQYYHLQTLKAAEIISQLQKSQDQDQIIFTDITPFYSNFKHSRLVENQESIFTGFQKREPKTIYQPKSAQQNSIPLSYTVNRETSKPKKYSSFLISSLQFQIRTYEECCASKFDRAEDRPKAAQHYHDLGEAYEYQAEYEKALDCYYKSLRIYESLYTETHPKVVAIYQCLGRTYDLAGQSEQSEECYEKFAHIKGALIKSGVYSKTEILKNFLFCWDEEDKFIKLLELLHLYRVYHGINSEETLEKYREVASYYDAMGEKQIAAEYYLIILKNNLSTGPRKCLEMAAGFCETAVSYYQGGQYQEALEYYLEAVETIQVVYGERNFRMVYLYNDLVYVYEALGDDMKVIEYLFKAYDLNKSLFGDELLKTLKFYQRLAEKYFHLESYQEAYFYLDSALEILRQIDGDKHPSLKYYHQSLADLADKLGDDKKAAEHRLAVITIENETLFSEHENPLDQPQILSQSSLEKNNDEIDDFFEGLE